MTEKEIDLVVERLTRRVENANIYFLKQIGEYIKQIRDLSPTEAHKLVQILKYGGNYQQIIKALAELSKMNVSDIDKIFNRYAKQDYNFYKQFYKYRNMDFIPFEKNKEIIEQTNAIKRLVQKQVYNIMRENVIGYTIRDRKGNIQFQGLRETYNRVLDEALMNVSEGKETFDSAMSKIMEDIGGSGLKKLDYESGRSVRLDSAIRMNLQDGLRELHNANQEIIGKQFGYDGYEISVHENPAIDHEKVQGHQFSIKEFEKLQNGEYAKDINGKEFTLDHDHKNGFRPISEMNCYHVVSTIILGVSKPRYTEEQLEQIIKKNNDGFEYNGKHYSLYDGEQLLRKIELEIRKSKDIQILARSSNNAELVEKMQSRITQLTSKYRDILKASGLKSKIERANVNGYRRVNIAKMK